MTAAVFLQQSIFIGRIGKNYWQKIQFSTVHCAFLCYNSIVPRMRPFESFSQDTLGDGEPEASIGRV